MLNPKFLNQTCLSQNSSRHLRTRSSSLELILTYCSRGPPLILRIRVSTSSWSKMAASPCLQRKTSFLAKEKVHSKARKENQRSHTEKWTISRNKLTTLFWSADEKLRRRPSRRLWPNTSKRTKMRRSLTNFAKSSWQPKKQRRTKRILNLRSKIRRWLRPKEHVRKEITMVKRVWPMWIVLIPKF